MLFSSIPFIYYFLPCVLILYFIVPRGVKNAVLLLASLVFYSWGEPVYVVLMAVSILVGYVSGILTEKYKGTKKAKIAMWTGVLIAFSFLGYFKYADFFIENFNAVTGLSIPLLRLTLPIGISFYTFQIASYIIDVYTGAVPAQRNIVSLACYVTMFPQLIAGPIVRYTDVEKQLKTRTHTIAGFSLGVRRLVIGLGKKILIANALGELCDVFRQSQDKSVLYFWMYAVAFSLHIYFDFSGYSDMAIGMGKMLGFDFPENFNYPYISRSIAEFWRRWHITLGTWFRDYVYIPLGGNKVSKGRWVFNILVVWGFTGFWHGSAWSFVIWGLYFAVFLMIEKFFLAKYLKKARILSHIYVLFFVMISFIIFNSASLSEAWNDIISLFGAGDLPVVSKEAVYYLKSYAVTFIVAVLGATPIVKKAVSFLKSKRVGKNVINIAEIIFSLAILFLVTAYLVDGSFNPFLYFRF